jgi:hypothetical protein
MLLFPFGSRFMEPAVLELRTADPFAVATLVVGAGCLGGPLTDTIWVSTAARWLGMDSIRYGFAFEAETGSTIDSVVLAGDNIGLSRPAMRAPADPNETFSRSLPIDPVGPELPRYGGWCSSRVPPDSLTDTTRVLRMWQWQQDNPVSIRVASWQADRAGVRPFHLLSWSGEGMQLGSDRSLGGFASIADLKGRKIWQGAVSPNGWVAFTPPLTPGFHFLEITGVGVRQSEILIIEE